MTFGAWIGVGLLISGWTAFLLAAFLGRKRRREEGPDYRRAEDAEWLRQQQEKDRRDSGNGYDS